MKAEEVLERVVNLRREKAEAGEDQKTFRFGIAGPPGAGKSTFIEAIGEFLTARGHKLGVVAIDPSSSVR
jgi:LAO/AO transport system kinase